MLYLNTLQTEPHLWCNGCRARLECGMALISSIGNRYFEWNKSNEDDA